MRRDSSPNKVIDKKAKVFFVWVVFGLLFFFLCVKTCNLAAVNLSQQKNPNKPKSEPK